MASKAPANWPILATEWYPYHEQVVAIVARQWPDVPREMIFDAFVDALVQVAERPDAYDPDQSAVATFLANATWRVVRGKYRSCSDRQRRREENQIIHVAEPAAAAREVIEELADQELAPLARAEIARTDEERRYLALWESGVDDPVQVALALGIGHLSPNEQLTEIQRMHKRLWKRLERFRARWSEE